MSGFRLRRRHWLVALGLAAVAAAGLWRLQSGKQNLARLIAAAPADVRFVEPRISGGFPWAPLAERRRREGSDPRKRKLIGEAAHVLSAASAAPSVEARRAAASAHLVTGAGKNAIATLETTPENFRDASWWNDVAAAHLIVALGSDSPDHLNDALAAVDQSLRFAPASPESLFNRALIIEGFHLREPAIEAWKKYLAVEPGGGWSSEARQHLDNLSRPQESFASEIKNAYSRLEAGDRAAANALVRLDAGEARYFAECEGLARWGEAWLRRDVVTAERHLTAAQTLAGALTDFNHEALLSDSVKAVQRASRLERDSLARGHVAFREGRRVSNERKPTEAEKILAGAARDLDAGGSPLAAELRFFTGVEIFEQNRVDEATALFRKLATSVPERYAALRGYVAWLQASCFMSQAQLGTSIGLFKDAVDIFERLREHGNAAFLHDIIAQVYDAVRDRTRSRKHRFLALRELGKTNSFRLEHAVFGMVFDAAQRKDWLAARSFLELEVQIARSVRDPELQANVLLRRAIVHTRFSDSEAADADLREATAIVAAVADPALRAKLEVDRDATAALVSSRPETAVRLLTDVLRFHETKGWRMLMPDLYLRRGRMYMAMGNRQRAVADFESGIAELERDRESLPAGEARWGVLDAADELFDEAIDAALHQSPARAFQYAERERARSLSDAQPDTAALDPATLPPQTVIIEYAVLPGKLVVFSVSRNDLRAEQRGVRREDLTSLIGKFTAATDAGASTNGDELAQTANQLFVAPVRDAVAAHREIVFVPDAATSSIPFAALTEPATGRPLFESHTVSLAPSARMYIAARERQARRKRTSVLIVDNSDENSERELSRVSSEAEAIRAEYPAARRLSGPAATVNAFLEEAERSDVIHFAGHGISSADSAALKLAAAVGQPDRIDATTISRLRLTRTSVVVLAACETARGPLRTAEGPLSVAYAFLQAGAPAVVATLQPISDRDAADFFPRLHRYLARGLPAAEALRQTQLDYIRDPRNAGSTIWTSVQSIGY